MKKFLMALAATSMIASPLIASQAQAAPYSQNGRYDRDMRHDNGRNARNDYRNGRNDMRYGQHRWAKGQRFDRRQVQNYRVITNPRAYHLNAAPRGYQWVQSGNDAVMVALVSGIIGAVIGNAIR